MTTIFKCDGCGAQESTKDGFHPHNWFERRDPDTNELKHACKRECIKDGVCIIPI